MRTRILLLVSIIALLCLGVSVSTAQPVPVWNTAPNAGDYLSASSGNWSDITTWLVWDGAEWVPAGDMGAPIPGVGVMVEIMPGHTIHVDAALPTDEWQVNCPPTGNPTAVIDSLTVDTLATLIVDAGCMITQNFNTGLGGRFTITAGSSGNPGVCIVNGTYQHNRDGGSAPTATWNTGSTLYVTGIIQNSLGNARQNWYNVTYNCAVTQTGTANLGWGPAAASTTGVINIYGDFEVFSSGSGRVQLSGSASGTAAAHTVAIINFWGNVEVSGGEVASNGTSNTNWDEIVNFYKSVKVNAPGIFNFTRGSMGTPAGYNTSLIWNMYGDTLALGAVTSSLKSSYQGRIVFKRIYDGTNPQLIDLTNTNYVSGQPVFEFPVGCHVTPISYGVAPAGGLSGVSLAGGILDTIALDGTTFHYGGSASCVAYSLESGPQTIDDYWCPPGVIGQIVINNPNGVYLDKTRYLTGGGTNINYLKFIRGILHYNNPNDTIVCVTSGSAAPTNPFAYADTNATNRVVPAATSTLALGGSNDIRTYAEGKVAIVLTRTGAGPAIHVPIGSVSGGWGRLIQFTVSQTAATWTSYLFEAVAEVVPVRAFTGTLNKVPYMGYFKVTRSTGGSAFTGGIIRYWYNNEGTPDGTNLKTATDSIGAFWIPRLGTNGYTPTTQKLVGNIANVATFKDNIIDANGSFIWTIANQSPGTNTLLGISPVELASFTAQTGSSAATLTWKTATEVNSHQFVLLRRTAGTTEWVRVAAIAAAGTSNSQRSYSYTDKVVAGTYVYQLDQEDNNGSVKTIGSLEVTVAAQLAPRVLSLSNAYPNPFNPTTNMTFTVPVSGNATLKVFNVIGQEVATVFSGFAKAEQYNQITFNASKLTTGVYFSVLEYGNQRLVKKLLLTK